MKTGTRFFALWCLLIIGSVNSFAQCVGTELIGNADDVTVFNTITNPTNALGVPDGTITGALDNDDALLLDLSDTIPAAYDITIHFSRIDDQGRATIDGSLDGRNFFDDVTNVAASFTTATITAYTFSISRPTRYVRIDRTAGTIGVDGVSYSACPDSDMDGVIDATELLNGDDRFDACDPAYVSADYLDCDGDKIMNDNETSTNGEDPCTPADFATVCDTDGDGVTDAYDDCAGTTPGTFVDARGCPTGQDCAYTPPAESSNSFSPVVVWNFATSIDARETPLVGDVDNDGTPDVIVDDYDDKVYVINGVTGLATYTIDLNGSGLINHNNSSNAIGDVDGDGYGEIFIMKTNDRWSRLDFDGTTWAETESGASAAELADDNRYTPQLADFNGDGTAELFSGSQIWNTDFSGGTDIIADAGDLLPDLGGSVAIDILPDAFCADCTGLELVMAGRIYSVNIGTGTLTEQVSANGLTGAELNGVGTGVADVDGDGDYDVAFVSDNGSAMDLHVWDGQTSSILMSYELPDSGNQSGRVNIADFDGDGFLEFGILYGDLSQNSLAYYAVVDDILTTSSGEFLWRIETNDGSGRTGTTVYDFDGDGASEVVYRDETDLRILRGGDGFVLFLTPCSSGTRYEFPVTADVNGDGLANILCTCNDIGLTTFESGTLPWVPARPVWNQHSYNITNINDDLSIPLSPNDNKTTGGGRFNNFLVQSPPVLPSGEPEVDVDPDGTITSLSMSNKAGCPAGLDFSVTIGNLGDEELSSSTRISVYDADPELGAANLLHTETIGITVAASGSETITVTVPTCVSGTFHFVLNDPGTTARPYSFSTDFPISNVSECDYSNNDDQVSVTLPIELSQFDAQAIGREVQLTWRTEVEIDNDFFTIERTLDNRTWETVAVVEGAGNSLFPIEYETVDSSPKWGLNYYRLKQTDFDATFTYSDIRTVQFDKNWSGDWQVFPNPAKNEIRVESTNPLDANIQIFDALGKSHQVASRFDGNDPNTANGVNLDISNLNPGVYFIVIGSQNLRFVKL